MSLRRLARSGRGTMQESNVTKSPCRRHGNADRRRGGLDTAGYIQSGWGGFSAWKLHTEYFPPIRMNPCRFMEGGIFQCCSDNKKNERVLHSPRAGRSALNKRRCSCHCQPGHVQNVVHNNNNIYIYKKIYGQDSASVQSTGCFGGTARRPSASSCII